MSEKGDPKQGRDWLGEYMRWGDCIYPEEWQRAHIPSQDKKDKYIISILQKKPHKKQNATRRREKDLIFYKYCPS